MGVRGDRQLDLQVPHLNVRWLVIIVLTVCAMHDLFTVCSSEICRLTSGGAKNVASQAVADASTCASSH